MWLAGLSANHKLGSTFYASAKAGKHGTSHDRTKERTRLLITAAILLTASCAGLAYISFRRNGDATLAAASGILVFVAFLAGSVLRPVEFTAKRGSLESAIAERISSSDQSPAAVDQQSLDDLPNIPVPANGRIDFVGVRSGGRLLKSRTPALHLDEDVELRGRISDPIAGGANSGLFVIVNSSQRISAASAFGSDSQKVAFIVDVPASLLRRGINQLELGAIANDERGFFKLPDRVTVTVAER